MSPKLVVRLTEYHLVVMSIANLSQVIYYKIGVLHPNQDCYIGTEDVSL